MTAVTWFRRAGIRSALLRGLAVPALALCGGHAAFGQAEPAVAALDRMDCEAAIDALNRGMSTNESRSFHLTGQLFEHGVCLKKDVARAATTYEQSARLGEADSARSLALLNARGSGMPQSYPRAGYWFAVMRHEAKDADTPASDAFAVPDVVARTYVEAVHDVAEDGMVYPQQAADVGVRGNVVMRFDPRSGVVSLVSSRDNRGNATDRLGPNKHLFEHALEASYDTAIKSMVKPAIPSSGDFATDHEVRFERDRNGAAGPYGYRNVHR